MRGYQARHQLALVYQAQGRISEALALWQAVVEEQPGFGPAWAQLGQTWLNEQRWPELEHAARRLLSFPPLALEGVMLLAKAHLTRREFGFARHKLDQVICKAPNAIAPKALRTHVLLQENQNGPEVEPALREVVELDPAQLDSWRNLVILLRQRQRYAEALETCCQARNQHPNDADLLLLEGLLHQDLRKYEEAEACFLSLLEKPVEGKDPSKIGPLRNVARHQLALIYRQRHLFTQAEVQWRAVVADLPDYAPASVQLGHLWLIKSKTVAGSRTSRCAFDQRSRGGIRRAGPAHQGPSGSKRIRTGPPIGRRNHCPVSKCRVPASHSQLCLSPRRQRSNLGGAIATRDPGN